MFNLLESALKVLASVVTVPVSLVADVVTLGGILTGKDTPYTKEELQKLMKNVQDLTE